MPNDVIFGDRNTSCKATGDLGVCRLAYRAKDLRGVRENTDSAKAARFEAVAGVAPAIPAPPRGVEGLTTEDTARSPLSSTGTTRTKDRSLHAYRGKSKARRGSHHHLATDDLTRTHTPAASAPDTLCT